MIAALLLAPLLPSATALVLLALPPGAPVTYAFAPFIISGGAE